MVRWTSDPWTGGLALKVHHARSAASGAFLPRICSIRSSSARSSLIDRVLLDYVIELSFVLLHHCPVILSDIDAIILLSPEGSCQTWVVFWRNQLWFCPIIYHRWLRFLVIDCVVMIALRLYHGVEFPIICSITKTFW